MSRRESIGRVMARKQSSAADPEMKMVSVAVLPPRLPPGMAPPTGLGPADVFSWDEAVNWQHNQPVQEEDPEKKKSLRKKLGLTTERTRKNPDLPPFTFRQVPYDTWRKHYAKDADGNYRGTHAPAEDCLLKPDDVAKWRLGEAQTNADRWTRGSEALPVYAEVRESAPAPTYDPEYNYAEQPPATEPGQAPTAHAVPETPPEHRRTIADGKTAAEIIEAAKNKPKEKKGFRRMMKDGATFAMLGN